LFRFSEVPRHASDLTKTRGPAYARLRRGKRRTEDRGQRTEDRGRRSEVMSLPSPKSVSARSPFANMKSDLTPRLLRRRHQLFDCGKDSSEFFIISLLQSLDFACEIRVTVHQAAKLDESAHDYAPASASSMCPAYGLPQCGMIAMLTSTARTLRSTLDSMATPCSVNA
jgi:hypothetical protein